MPAKKVALFVDAETLQGRLRSLHHRTLDPALLLETAAAQGEVVTSTAVASWSDLPTGLQERFTEAKIETVNVVRVARGRRGCHWKRAMGVWRPKPAPNHWLD